jgi:hypothetical protein
MLMYCLLLDKSPRPGLKKSVPYLYTPSSHAIMKKASPLTKEQRKEKKEQSKTFILL